MSFSMLLSCNLLDYIYLNGAGEYKKTGSAFRSYWSSDDGIKILKTICYLLLQEEVWASIQLSLMKWDSLGLSEAEEIIFLIWGIY